MDDLPSDMINHIFNFLPIEDAARCQTVNQNFHAILEPQVVQERQRMIQAEARQRYRTLIRQHRTDLQLIVHVMRPEETYIAALNRLMFGADSHMYVPFYTAGHRVGAWTNIANFGKQRRDFFIRICDQTYWG